MALFEPPARSPRPSRRDFLRLGGLGAVGLAVSACGGGSSGSSSGAGAPSAGASAASGALGDISMQLSWIKNIEFGGEYMADSKGYYAQAGLSKVDLVTGPVDSADALVVAGNVTVGVSAPDATARFITEQGAPLKIIGAIYQKNPFCILSIEQGKPIHTLADLTGKTVGIQAGTNQQIFAGFLKANGIDPIDKDRDKLKAFLKAEVQGWNDAVADPAAAAKLAVETYGKDLKLDLAGQTEQAQAQNGLVTSDETKADGLFTLSAAAVAANLKSLSSIGITVTADQLFDLSLIREVHAENPNLKTAS
jgi:ABC-type nitrate/sulfonate/bicarbonate transport system substrate-binding protein